MAMTTTQAKVFLAGLLPPGFVRWFDFSAGSFGDLILEGAAEQFALRVATPTDIADANNNPWTLASDGIAAWESALGLTPPIGAVDGTRLGAIIARLRETGSASTLPAIRAIIGPLLGYADPTQL